MPVRAQGSCVNRVSEWYGCLGIGVGSRFGPYVRDVVFEGSERLTLETSNSDSIWGWIIARREQ